MTSRYILRFWTSETSSLVTKYGPVGPKVSQDFPLVHCPSFFSWNSLSETSLTTQYPAINFSASSSLIYLAFFPIIIPSSTSQSVSLEFLGISTLSFGPTTADVAFENNIG